MTTPFFWVDMAAYGVTALVAMSLMLAVLGTGVRRLINGSFSLFMLAVGFWTSTSVILRVALWFGSSTQQLWMEVSTLAFSIIGPLLLIFSGAYTQTRHRWPYALAVLGLASACVLCIPLFTHRVVSDVRLEANGVLTWDRTLLGYALSVPLLVDAALSLFLLWSERERLRENYLSVGISILVVSGLVFSFVVTPLPTLSIAMLLAISIMGYAVLRRQLFNPLQELTDELEQRVMERTRELAGMADELQAANAALERRGRRLEAAAWVARESAAVQDVARLLDTVVRLISSQFDLYHVGIFLLDEAREYAVLRASSSEGGQRMQAEGHEVKVGEENIIGLAVHSGEPRIALGVGPNVISNDPELPDTRSQVVLLLRARGQVIGALDLRSAEEGAFTEEDVTLLQNMADQVGLAIENARLLEETQDRLREIGTLLGRYEREGWERLMAARPDWGYVYDGVKVVPRSEAGPLDAEPKLTVSLRLRGEAVGRLSLVLPDRPSTPEDVALVEAVAEQVSVALESARLYQETQRRAAHERLVGEITARVRETLDLESVLRTAVDEMYKSLGLDQVAIRLAVDERDDGKQ